jgi:hypothetical protein
MTEAGEKGGEQPELKVDCLSIYRKEDAGDAGLIGLVWLMA